MNAKARIALGVVAVAAVFAAVRLLPVAEWLRAFQDWVHGQGVVGAVAFGVVYVVAVLLFVPGSVLTIGAGLTFGVVRGALIVWLAATTASALAFLIARHLARSRFEELARRNATFGAIDAAIRERGWRVVLLLRLSPLVPFSLSNYLYGLTAVDLVPYLWASAVGMIPGTFLYVYLGAAGAAATGAAGRRDPLEWVLFGVGLVATAAAAVLVGRSARRQLRAPR
jgi:uncharacterized membrane protein YdjX (TVP38/TMEM64 family)